MASNMQLWTDMDVLADLFPEIAIGKHMGSR